ncbi:MAG: hypothetical protein KAJ59_04375 [Thermodesulfovibrionia bacterium]|nr:hypothetical protein [Thermodesulfovibrionia bacterium]
MKRFNTLLLTILLTAGLSSVAMAVGAGRGIGTEQSCHNFSHESWKPVTAICRICHIPHSRKATQRYKTGLPWDSEISSATYTVHESPWSSSLTGVRDPSWSRPLTGTQGTYPDGIAKLCLGCHDSVIAIDTFVVHHLVSIEYDSFKTQLRNANLTKMGLSGNIAEVLDAGKVQCSSCHDVHDEESVANTKLLRVKKSILCTICHFK